MTNVLTIIIAKQNLAADITLMQSTHQSNSINYVNAQWHVCINDCNLMPLQCIHDFVAVVFLSFFLSSLCVVNIFQKGEYISSQNCSNIQLSLVSALVCVRVCAHACDLRFAMLG